MKTSRLDLRLERLVSKHISESLSGKTQTRWQFVAEKPADALCTIGEEILRHAACVFVQKDEGGKQVTCLACAKDAFDMVEGAANSNEIISFIFDVGAITLSFDESEDHLRKELHVVCWGEMRDYINRVAAQYAGTLY